MLTSVSADWMPSVKHLPRQTTHIALKAISGPAPKRRGPLVELHRGSVVWLDFDPVKGREQGGRRPAVVIAGNGYLSRATSIAIVVPITTTDRGWPNHIRLAGTTLTLDRPSFAMTEQPRTVDRRRITGTAGEVDESTMRSITVWLRDFLDL